MSRTDLDPTTTRALSALDPSPARALSASEQQGADALLARILATPTTGEDARPTPTASRRTARRLAVVGGLAAASTAGIVAVQVLGGGDSAYATWTATPHRPTTPEQLAAADSCRDSLSDSLSGGPEGDPTGVTHAVVARAGVVLSEQRGDWTLVVLGDRQGFDATCITDDPGLLGGSGSAFGSMGYATGGTDVGAREVLVTSGGSGGSSDHLVSVLVGLVGPEVAAVTIHTPEHGDVVATVGAGHLAAWWPGPTGVGLEDPSLDTTPPATVTYKDGTSAHVRLGVGEKG
ncbi:hypothetical protein G7075_03960 [Phycicoccus sp. HDW14]|uniref:hypothetical protein n=1 Tax=Phycicoccus sp. HDW14 TaxID=2714941 RepID=UPI00140CD7CC|nr:hypothetical protein [Phycicoccus sp. HDW14]QIM20493.1 hypothetical protein G7075_03960 [Phycicoccus sp. HDW14]